MSPTIVTCQYCGKKNRIRPDRIGQRAKCGSCGHVIVSNEPRGDTCPLCQDIVSNGVLLSNGRIVHEACLEGLQNRQEEIKSKIDAKKREISQLQRRIEQQNGLAFKLKSLFSKPRVEIDDLNNSIANLQSDIEGLSSGLSVTKRALSSVYDYFVSYPPDWDERRLLLINSKGNFCSICGTTSPLHVHHVKPFSQGGSNELSNLMLLCESCHSREHGGRDFSGEFEPSETAFSKRVSDIRYAINNGKRIQFGYRKPTDKGYRKRTVHPARLENIDHHRDSGSTLCVRGYCELRKAERVFALKRMRGLKII